MGSTWVAYLKRALVKPNPAAVTALVVIIYAAIFIYSVVIFETVPAPPEPAHQRGLNLDRAWKDLQEITRQPNSYTSFANHRVRAYLRKRLRAISFNVGETEDDGMFIRGADFGHGIKYLEADNQLLKINGNNTSLPAVLFSTQYGSVSTGIGATNNGMGLVTLLQLAEYYTTHKPERTVIFNFNKGKNDWLNGAHVFLNHEWSELPTTFLNIEGVGNGGRPLLSRTSSFAVTSSFRSIYQPYGSTPSSDAFSRGLFRPSTDFSVYENAGMRGLELAFYRQRSRDHTVYGSEAWLGDKGSLWLMMENALEVGNALVSGAASFNATDAGFLHMLGSAIVVIPRPRTALNIILLLLGPLIVAIVVVTSPGGYREAWNWVKVDKRQWIHAPVMLITTLASTLGLAAIFAAVNTNIVFSSPSVVVISLISAAILALIVSAKIVSYYLRSIDTTLLTTANHSIFALIWWLLLCWPTGRLHINSVGGPDYVTYAYTGQLLALILSLGTMLHLVESPALTSDRTPLGVNGAEGDQTPLCIAEPNKRSGMFGREEHLSVAPVDKSRCTWAPEILVSFVLPCTSSTGTLILLLTALSQALGDEKSPMTVYLAFGFLSVLIVLPIAPIALQLHRAVAFFLVLVCLGSTVHNLIMFPSSRHPLNAYIEQTVDLDQGMNQVRPITLPFPGLGEHIRSARPGIIRCDLGELCHDPMRCVYVGPVPNTTFDSYPPAKWVWQGRVGNGTDFDIHSRYTRSCRIYSDTYIAKSGYWKHITRVESEGFEEMRLWSRTLDSPSRVYVTWAPESTWPREGEVVCDWEDWDEGQVSYWSLDHSLL